MIKRSRCVTQWQWQMNWLTEAEEIYRKTSKIIGRGRETITFWLRLCLYYYSLSSIGNGAAINGGEQGVTKRCRLFWLTNSALVYEPKCGGRGELRGLSQWVQLYTGAQINFGNLTQCLTCGGISLETITLTMHAQTGKRKTKHRLTRNKLIGLLANHFKSFPPFICLSRQ